MKNTYSLAAAGALAVTAVAFIVEVAPGQDFAYPLFMLAGPLLTGAVLGPHWRIGAAAWSLAALIWLVLDWAINHEDVAFHAVVSVLFACLVALGAGAARLGRRARA